MTDTSKIMEVPPKEIARWRHRIDHGDVIQSPRGEFVRYEDVKHLLTPAETPERLPVAWMTEEDSPRVASAWTREGMHKPLQQAFCIPLYRNALKAGE